MPYQEGRRAERSGTEIPVRNRERHARIPRGARLYRRDFQARGWRAQRPAQGFRTAVLSRLGGNSEKFGIPVVAYNILRQPRPLLYGTAAAYQGHGRLRRDWRGEPLWLREVARDEAHQARPDSQRRMHLLRRGLRTPHEATGTRAREY